MVQPREHFIRIFKRHSLAAGAIIIISSSINIMIIVVVIIIISFAAIFVVMGVRGVADWSVA